MTINANKQVNVNGTVFNFAQFSSNPDNYMELIRPFFRPTTLIMRDGMDRLSFLNYIFCMMYYKKGLAYNNSNVCCNAQTRQVRRTRCRTETACDQILSALGIDIVKHNPKISKVVFKNSGNTYKMKNADMEILAESIKKGTKFTRNNLDVSIGVELEFIGDRTKVREFEQAMLGLVGVGKFENKGCYNKNDGRRWILGLDGSLSHREGYPYIGYELTSPILHFTEEDMGQLRDVINLVVGILNGHTNKTCGTHVHMSFNCGGASESLCNHFGRSYRYSEEAFFDKLVPSNRRMNRSRWCRATSCYPSIGNRNDRYRKLNFSNVTKYSDKMHLEFRQLDGTLDYDKIYSWIKLQKMFIELTMDSWNAMPSDEPDKEKIVLLDVNEFITCGDLDPMEIEAVMKMSNMVA